GRSHGAPDRGRAARDRGLPQSPPEVRAVGALAAHAAVTTALSVRDVAKRFGELHALRGISFDAHPGEVVAVVGPNGAGKTTLLSIIAGTQLPSAGSVVGPASANSARGIGWVPQQPALYSKLSVSEHLRRFAGLDELAG